MNNTMINGKIPWKTVDYFEYRKITMNNTMINGRLPWISEDYYE